MKASENKNGQELIKHDLDKYIAELTDKYFPEGEIKTFDNHIVLFSTPEFKYEGVAVKKAFNNSASKSLLEKEVETFLKLGKVFDKQEKYKIPELLKYNLLDGVIVMQRLLGLNAVGKVMSNLTQRDNVIKDISGWISVLHSIDSEEKEYKVEDTSIYQRFNSFLEHDLVKSPNDQSLLKVKKLLENWSQKTFVSKFSLLQGDLSPIHFYFEKDGVYSIDFNGGKYGPVEEDIASFVSNSRYHFINATGSEEMSEQINESLIDTYSKDNSL
ncbi:hypothetical protein HOD29_01500, partial [archaeon]|nr:hypothetical protein [archaeon]